MAGAVGAALLASGGARAAAKLEPWGGKTAPPLTLKDIQGGEHDLSRYRGKVVLVNFWATWCEPCRYEMPSMQRLKEKLADKPFELLAVNLDEPEARVRRSPLAGGLRTAKNSTHVSRGCTVKCPVALTR